MSSEFQFCKMKDVLETDSGDACTSVEGLNDTELERLSLWSNVMLMCILPD